MTKSNALLLLKTSAVLDPVGYSLRLYQDVEMNMTEKTSERLKVFFEF